MTVVENKIANISNFVRKKQIMAQKLLKLKKKITDHNHDKYVTTPESSTLPAHVFNTRLAQANLVTKTDFDNRVSNTDSKTATNKTKNDSIENELKKLKTFESSYFRGKSHFEEDGTQIDLVFQPIQR